MRRPRSPSRSRTAPQTFLIGSSVYGGSDRYVLEQGSNRVYVFSKDMVSGLEMGESVIHLTDPRGFDLTTVDQVVIEASGKTKVLGRMEQTRPTARCPRPGANPTTKEAEPDRGELHRQGEPA